MQNKHPENISQRGSKNTISKCFNNKIKLFFDNLGYKRLLFIETNLAARKQSHRKCALYRSAWTKYVEIGCISHSFLMMVYDKKKE
jgi:hypothetical protein